MFPEASPKLVEKCQEITESLDGLSVIDGLFALAFVLRTVLCTLKENEREVLTATLNAFLNQPFVGFEDMPTGGYVN